ncbi:MAG: tRNA (adenosine(37)-N6)-dimethylallyltransferase MiaA, partial [candidate division Zixibacteria bacterium]|nr:tRNA (adenosine(37)-N6)-dimethylallyltransferase MiaA [candidate division Zixibacteria bacterium]NIS48097.1 tRNA (adenosine(37)-N6)-dimethylallyltransferase MiaA [candidate division Zixibacteria bacterium]NIU14831.1 tRNA (adenosine(37)-N6)-dimethylallyltransferase MiaA [candidate division Zixibacteria bacterium]NIV06831.1 tRNA (adenosine(37)-N6)-dimethylallyltransferase MiaA [candidate division Zixibacteria bacterium]NIW48019.1 tRNA (adenosine(37)-N6)-dimethylallyltransferase MiaA [Gammaprot
GTAKPTKEELLSVRHHLIDVADPDETWSLSKYHRRVYQLLEEITQREKLPVLVGGTGQYIFSIIENWKIPEVRPDQDMRDALYDWVDKISPSGLYERLVHIDPEVEAIIQPENVRRTVRALEVIFHSGKKFTDSRGPGPQLYQPIMIGLSRSREILYQRIDQRLDRMLENGFIKEVKALIEEGYPPDSPAFSAIGYRQLIAYLQGYISLKDAIMEIRKSSRILV